MTAKRKPLPHAKRGRKPGNKKIANGKTRGTIPGVLTPLGRTSTPAHKEATQEAARIERRWKAFRLYVDHKRTMMEIAEHLGCSNATVCKDIWAGVEEYRQAMLADVKRWVPVQIARTERILKECEPKGTERLDPAYGRVALQALDHQAKLLGLYAPTKVTATDISGTKPFGGLSDAELDVELRTLALTAGVDYQVVPVHGNGSNGGNGTGAK